MSTTQASVRIQAPAGAWETLGVDRARGVVPENIQLTSTDQGPDTASFDLRRDPGVPWPDLGALSPVEVRIGGVLVWDGFVSQTPTRDGAEDVVSVQARGWQYYLDEDVFRYGYVQADMTQWQDVRSIGGVDEVRYGPGTDLSHYQSTWQVSTGDAPSITWPGTLTAPGGGNEGAIALDFGPAGVKKIAVRWDHNGDGNGFLSCSGAVDNYPSNKGESADEYFSTGLGVAAQANVLTIFTFTDQMRYVVLSYGRSAAFAFGGDVWIKFHSIVGVPVSSWMDGSGNPTVNCGQIVTDIINRGAPLVSADKSLVSSSSFVPPSFAFPEARTPREWINGVNAFHDWQTGVAVGKRPMFRPRPTLPRYQIGGWGGAEFSDASAGDASEIYDRCIVEGQDVAGQALSWPVATPASGYLTAACDASVANPDFTTSFDDNTSPWYEDMDSTTFSRDTGTYVTSPASLKVEVLQEQLGHMVSALTDITAPTGGWMRGKTYIVSVSLKGGGGDVRLAFGILNRTTGFPVASRMVVAPGSGFAAVYLAFQPGLDEVGADLSIRLTLPSVADTGVLDYWVDQVRFFELHPTVNSRWLRRRTKSLQVSNPINQTTAQRIGETFLAGHQQTPLKGDVSAAYGGIRDMDSRAVHPSLLLLEAGGVLQLSDRVDPDTGAVGRLGQIASVSYDHSNETAQISLDNQRNRIESFLERLAVVTGAALQR